MKWLDREVHIPGPHLTLCTTEEQFLEAASQVKFSPQSPWVSPSGQATTWILQGPLGLTAVVCIRPPEGRSAAEIAALLVHEAVHVWRAHCRDIGETSPSEEFEAYGIQLISERLIQAYADSL